MRKLALHWKIIIALVIGIIWAFVSSFLGISEFTLNWIDPFGKIFVNLLKMIAVPLVMFSIMKGVADLKDISKLGKMGGKTLGLYVITTVFAVTLGLGLVNIIKPGDFLTQEQLVNNRIDYEIWANESGNEIKDDKRILSDPQYAEQVAAYYANTDKTPLDMESIESKLASAESQKNERPLQFLVDIVPSNFFVALTSNKLMLQVIFFAIFFGVCLLLIPPGKGAPLLSIVDAINEVFLKMVDIIMRYSPFFVFALLAGKFSEMAGDDPKKLLDTLSPLVYYSLTVVIGLGFMIFILYPSIMLLIVKRKITYGGFFKRISPAQFLAFSTSSSAATLPVTLECVRDRLGVSKEVSSFVLPIGATVNMDGTSLYQAVAAIFLAQYHWIDLDLSQQLTIIVTATLASIGSAAVPSAGLVMLMIVLGSVGLNPAWVAIILPIDRILDMCRTVVNVTGDATVATVVASTEGELNVVSDEALDAIDQEEIEVTK